MSNDLDQSVIPEDTQDSSEEIDDSTWYWRCPKCGETGIQDMDDMFSLFSFGPHGNQHAESAFGAIVPLEMSDTPFTADTPPFEPLPEDQD